ncbi:MAG: DinB family protein [Anaerolineales bacterium]|nr:DinB family protein [Anaerolineales bacterium]
MTLTLLLDLDDSLLKTNQAAFVPAYFQALSTRLAPRLDPNRIGRALLAGTNAMNHNQDFSRSLKDVFDDVFYPALNLEKNSLEAEIETFYDESFPTLQAITEKKPEARPFIDWAKQRGYRLVVATDPLLPRKAAHHRIRWAGFDPEEFELITVFEDFHFSKSFPAYYAEVLGRIGWSEGPVIMIGNDIERDILPAKRLGLPTFFLDGEPGSSSRPEAGLRGSLPDLRRYLESAAQTSLLPDFSTKEAILAILSSTPAVLNGLTFDLDPALWAFRPDQNEWTLTELLCHLRDTEREIHQRQLSLFNGQGAPFIPRPDTGVWASQRDYAHEDGPAALRDFIAARRETLEILTNTNDQGWRQKARHAIFGPTDFREVTGFIADHDRMHIHQAWADLKRL